MKTETTTERRRGRRVEARLQIELQLEPGSKTHASDTINISANGVYFRSPRFVAPLTKLGLRLMLPIDGTEQAVGDRHQGVVGPAKTALLALRDGFGLITNHSCCPGAQVLQVAAKATKWCWQRDQQNEQYDYGR